MVPLHIVAVLALMPSCLASLANLVKESRLKKLGESATSVSRSSMGMYHRHNPHHHNPHAHLSTTNVTWPSCPVQENCGSNPRPSFWDRTCGINGQECGTDVTIGKWAAGCDNCRNRPDQYKCCTNRWTGCGAFQRPRCVDRNNGHYPCYCGQVLMLDSGIHADRHSCIYLLRDWYKLAPDDGRFRICGEMLSNFGQSEGDYWRACHTSPNCEPQRLSGLCPRYSPRRRRSEGCP